MENESQQQSAVDLLQQIAQTEELVGFFSDMFDVMGITIEETGEELTVRISEDGIAIAAGLPDEYDFLVPLKMENITNMVDHAEGGSLTEFAVWRIASVLFTPLTRETLKNPVMSNGYLRRLARVEDLIHVKLVGPQDQQVFSHTLTYAAGQWLVAEGLHGEPKRVFTLTGEQCINYQRQVFKAIRTNRLKGWLDFMTWYTKWRANHSTTTGSMSRDRAKAALSKTDDTVKSAVRTSRSRAKGALSKATKRGQHS